MSNLTDEQIEAIYKQETGALIDDSPWALLDFSRAIESAATGPLLQRIAELEENERAFKQVILQMQDSIDFLQRQLEEARKDAERYRWLVAQMMHPDADHQEEMFNRLHAINPDPANAKEVDAAIDAAMRGQQ